MSLFITFEGPDGSGKTTQARLLAEHLQACGQPVLLTREPGGTTIGEQIRDLVLSNRHQTIRHETEALLFSAARAQIVDEIIRPALAQGRIVICDRYADSTMAYQGYGLGLDLDALRAITQFATGGLTPDVTVYVDVPVEVGLERRHRGEMNRLDRKDLPYHQRVRAGFLRLAQDDPRRWLVVNGDRPTEQVQQEIRTGIEQRMEGR